MATPNLNLPTTPQGATNISIAYNKAMQIIDAVNPLIVQTIGDTSPPTTTAGADLGKRWIVGDSATGDWSGHDNEIALCVGDGLWQYIVPANGFRASNIDDGITYKFDGSDWASDAGSGISDAPSDGVLRGRKDGVWEVIPDVIDQAEDIDYDNTASSLPADNVQDAIDLLVGATEDNATAIAAITPVTTLTIITEASTSTMDPATHAGVNRYIRAADDVTFNVSESYAAGEAYNIRATAALTLIGTGVTLTPPAGGTLDLDAAMSVTVVMTSSSAGDVLGQTVAAP